LAPGEWRPLALPLVTTLSPHDLNTQTGANSKFKNLNISECRAFFSSIIVTAITSGMNNVSAKNKLTSENQGLAIFHK